LDASPLAANPWADSTGVRLLSVGMMRPGAKTESYAALAAALRMIGDLDWTLVIVGGGTQETEIRSMFSEFSAQRIVFAGERLPGEVLALMELSDVLAWPGCREAYGMVYLEAASRGKPSVALRNMGVPRVVENGRTGLLADPPDAATYAACLRTIIDNSVLRRALGQGAQEFVAGERSGRAAASRLKTILDAVLAGYVA
jgi:glycosyltransferase involved in cell wall biosynthesis